MDALGQVHIAGETKSADFPVTAGAARPTFGGGTFDAVYARLSADGSLGYGTYIGGTDTDQAFGVAVDEAGAAYILGGTNSSVAERFPVTGNAYSGTLNGLRDVFVARISTAGAMTYCSYFGGSSSEAFYSGDIVVDDAGRVVFASDTSSGNMPVTASARQGVYGGGTYDGFLARIDTSVAGTAGLLYSTFIGGTSNEAVYGLARDTAGRVYLAGQTTSANFPVTAGAYDTTFNTGVFAEDAFVAKYDITLSGAASQMYSTFIGGNDRESLFDIAVDVQGRAHVVGQSRATDFPLVQPVDSHFFIFEAIVSILDPTGARSCSRRTCRRMPTAARSRRWPSTRAGETYVVGATNATAAQSAALPNGFPVMNAMQPTYGGGGSDAVLQKLGFSIDLSLTKTPARVSCCPDSHVTFTLTVDQPSSDPASGVVVTDTLPSGLQFVSCAATQAGICAGTGNARTSPSRRWRRRHRDHPDRGDDGGGDAGPADPQQRRGRGRRARPGAGQQHRHGHRVRADARADRRRRRRRLEQRLRDHASDSIPSAVPARAPTTIPMVTAGRTSRSADGTHPRGFVITYLAEGATGAFFDTRLAIANPTAAAGARADALPARRRHHHPGLPRRPPMSRTTIDVEAIAGLEAAEFSTLIEADVQVVADRTMTWDERRLRQPRRARHPTRTATKWYFAEGATFGNFNLFYLIQNPNNRRPRSR